MHRGKAAGLQSKGDALRPLIEGFDGANGQQSSGSQQQMDDVFLATFGGQWLRTCEDPTTGNCHFFFAKLIVDLKIYDQMRLMILVDASRVGNTTQLGFMMLNDGNGIAGNMIETHNWARRFLPKTDLLAGRLDLLEHSHLHRLGGFLKKEDIQVPSERIQIYPNTAYPVVIQQLDMENHPSAICKFLVNCHSYGKWPDDLPMKT